MKIETKYNIGDVVEFKDTGFTFGGWKKRISKVSKITSIHYDGYISYDLEDFGSKIPESDIISKYRKED